ncbi:hypothetical protein COLO4_35332 [Corchorus olitorius]|uniref:Uncharacterized protein n=1 Tax=Corchorus olitorius TaxID=93759 RepID=A0A1R3GHF1_9ROSI|nr:hypothetical protein COLO4_35332 [Corchorus olitorius]
MDEETGEWTQSSAAVPHYDSSGTRKCKSRASG